MQDLIAGPSQLNRNPLDIQSLSRRANLIIYISYDLRRAEMAIRMVGCFATLFQNRREPT